jgi:hypothetical protein
MSAKLWEILVPTIRRVGGKPYTTRFHRVWDKKVREISKGLTILTPSKGQWVAPDGELFVERMIPVRFMASRENAEKIAKFTAVYYDQIAVLCYLISEEVILSYRDAVKLEPCILPPLTAETLLSPSMRMRVRYTDGSANELQSIPGRREGSTE